MKASAILFAFGVCMLLVGFLLRVGKSGFRDVSSSFGILFFFMIILFSCSSLGGLSEIFEGLCNGFELVGAITDYGSLHAAMHQDPMRASQAFFDVVILAFLINIIDAIPFVDSWKEKMGNRRSGGISAFLPHLAGWILGRIIIAIIATMILNYVIKQSGPYKWLFSSVGAMIILLALAVAVVAAIAYFRRDLFAGGFRKTLGVFSGGSFARTCWKSVLQAFLLVLGIWILEWRFGTVANALSNFAVIVAAFAPSVMVIIALAFILNRAFR